MNDQQRQIAFQQYAQAAAAQGKQVTGFQQNPADGGWYGQVCNYLGQCTIELVIAGSRSGFFGGKKNKTRKNKQKPSKKKRSTRTH